MPDLCNGADDNCNGDVDEDAMTDWQLVSIDHETSTIWQINRSDGSETLLAPLVNAGPAEIPTMDTRGDGVSVVYDAYGYALNDIDV